MLSANVGHVHLWLVFPDQIQDSGLLQDYMALLSAPERAQLAKFHFARDRHRYLLTRACIRTVLSRYAEVAPAQWEFVPGAYGRPRIANQGGEIGSLSFNISHTAGLILVGVTRGGELGVDVESLAARPAHLEIARSYFAPDECELLRATPPLSRAEMFFRIWTLKESYVKARGFGLAMPLDRFSFRIQSQGALDFTAHPLLDDVPERWHFVQLRLSTDHVAAICMRRLAGGPHTHSARAIVPLASDRAFEYDCLGMTEWP